MPTWVAYVTMFMFVVEESALRVDRLHTGTSNFIGIIARCSTNDGRGVDDVVAGVGSMAMKKTNKQAIRSALFPLAFLDS